MVEVHNDLCSAQRCKKAINSVNVFVKFLAQLCSGRECIAKCSQNPDIAKFGLNCKMSNSLNVFVQVVECILGFWSVLVLVDNELCGALPPLSPLLLVTVSHASQLLLLKTAKSSLLRPTNGGPPSPSPPTITITTTTITTTIIIDVIIHLLVNCEEKLKILD